MTQFTRYILTSYIITLDLVYIFNIITSSIILIIHKTHTI